MNNEKRDTEPPWLDALRKRNERKAKARMGLDILASCVAVAFATEFFITQVNSPFRWAMPVVACCGIGLAVKQVRLYFHGSIRRFKMEKQGQPGSIDKVQHLLKGAKGAIADPANWTKNARGRTEKGKPVDPTAVGAVKLDMVGAIQSTQVFGGHDYNDADVEEAIERLAEVLHHKFEMPDLGTPSENVVTRFNDNQPTTHEGVMMVFDVAIDQYPPTQARGINVSNLVTWRTRCNPNGTITLIGTTVCGEDVILAGSTEDCGQVISNIEEACAYTARTKRWAKSHFE